QSAERCHRHLGGMMVGQSRRPSPLLVNDDHPIVTGQCHRGRSASGVKEDHNRPPGITVGMLSQRITEELGRQIEKAKVGLDLFSGPQAESRMGFTQGNQTPVIGEDFVKTGFTRPIQLIDRIGRQITDRKSTRLNSSHVKISYAVFCLKKKKDKKNTMSSK